MKLLPLATLTACLLIGSHATAAGRKPNVLFIAMDDLNDWIGCLGGHPQTKTPNLDRLAKSGVLFRNAHCPRLRAILPARPSSPACRRTARASIRIPRSCAK